MEPTTVAAVVEIIGAIGKAASEIEAAQTYSRWQKEVSNKLDDILRNTELILKDLQQLRVDFRADLSAAFATEYQNKLKGELLNLAAVLAPLADGAELDDDPRFRTISAVERIRTILYSSVAYGSSTAPLALAAVSALYPAMRIARLPEQEISLTKFQIVGNVLRPLLDPTRVGSIAHAIQVATDEVSRYSSRLATIVGPVTVGVALTNPVFQGHNAFFQWLYDIEQYVCTISGNMANPNDYSATELETIVIQREATGFENVLFMRKFDPPIDESGSLAGPKHLALALRLSLVRHAADSAAARIAELHIIEKLTPLQALAKSFL